MEVPLTCIYGQHLSEGTGVDSTGQKKNVDHSGFPSAHPDDRCWPENDSPLHLYQQQFV